MSDPSPPSRWLVSTAWLAAHLQAPDIVVVDGSYYLPNSGRDAHAEYLAAHIPGAVFFDIDAIADHATNLPHMLPRPEAFASAMRALGIGDGETIVVYDGSGLYGAARVWWTFRVFGVREVFILDGGLPKWRTEGRSVDSGAVRRLPRHFTARLDHGAVAALADVQKALATGSAQVVDARAPERFRGQAAEPRPGLRSGRMPGALNVPFQTLVENGRLVARERIAQAFAAAGVDLERPIITTCGSGVTAAILSFALDALGRPSSLYDGSWAEWGARNDLAIAKD
jgi:thiosulfate/3-mercaptopyruvate sulfurtransferase